MSRGLTSQEAERLLSQFGPNVLAGSTRTSLWQYLGRVFREPMLLLLCGVAAVYFAVGDFQEGVLLCFSAGFVVALSLYQEVKSGRALEALRNLSSPRALVIRDGQEVRIASSEIVPGDLAILAEGDRIPADGEWLPGASVAVDESALTGESAPVHRQGGEPAYFGTLVLQGRGRLSVQKTGSQSEVGKLGKSLTTAVPERSQMLAEVRGLVRTFGWGAAVICTAVVFILGIGRGTWIQAILAGLSTAMSLLPEEFPVILTIFMAMGAWRLARVNMLVRSPRSIERLGAITTLCVDKTGTLTCNQMTLKQVASPEALRFAHLASSPDPIDPMEKSIALAAREPISRAVEREYPLSPGLFAMSCARKVEEGHYEIATKGAPEAVLDLCRLTGPKRDQILNTVRECGAQGLRVLGVARATFAGTSLPEDHRAFEFEWVGWIAFEDPIRPNVPRAVRECRAAGIRVLMMTGDHPETARKIAREAGLEPGGVLVGPDVERWDAAQLRRGIAGSNVFARMSPHHKLRVVQALQELGEVVAMTGDGVNDAPSLHSADVGLAMGMRGTDVAREAADLVLLDDAFESIVAGISRGRAIYENLRKALGYVAAIHAPLAGLAVIPAVLGWPTLLFPIHIVFLEMIIDPASSLLYEGIPPRSDLMLRPPRPKNARLISGRELLQHFARGLGVLALALLAYLWQSQSSEGEARAAVYLVLLFGNLGLILISVGRGLRPLVTLLMVGGTLLLALILVTVPSVKALFHF